MKKRNLIFAACALSLVGCQLFPPGNVRSLEGFDPRLVRQPEPLFPNVFITSGENIVVDQEPIRIPKGDSKQITITWALAAGSPYTFLGDGIEVGDGKEKDKRFSCGVLGAPRKLAACSFNRLASGTVVKYTVRVRGGPKGPPALDPTIMLE